MHDRHALSRRRRPSRVRIAFGLGALVAFGLFSAGCTTDSEPLLVSEPAPPFVGPKDPPPGSVHVVPGDGADDFVSHVAGQSTETSATREGGVDAAASTFEGPTSGEAARAIAEADIIQVQGDRLFALSRYAGLTVVNVADPADLRVEGTHRVGAVPFEMYLRGDTAYVMFNGYWKYVHDEEAGMSAWQSSARMQALDVSDPARIRSLGEYEVPGEISDSRMVGDVLYLVTYENGWCWRCDRTPNTRVASFDASDPTQFARIDELRFESQEASWGARSISVTSKRMYVAGPQWSREERGGTIQVVDISDPAGTLELGAEVTVAGRIDNRWQMDEHNGILRVISQAGGWNSNSPPEVETFRVESAQQLVPLGQLTMTLPRPEALRTVRFDGDRAYAITFERTDPLFTIDLSEPAAPRQTGELEIPGWVYHMEPRGDRIYGLGYDDADAGRGLTVSIFDVSDISMPTMLDRVVFGGEWAWQVEDQDRIHKAFNLLLDQELILVPFAGSQRDEATCRHRWQSGIQIISATADELTLRGVAPQIGTARRSLLHEGVLLGISDNAVQAFDIDDLDAPRPLDKLEVARNISSVHVVDDHLLRFGNDWWTRRAVVDLAPIANATTPEPAGELDLSDVFEDETDECNASAYWGQHVYVHHKVAYVPRYEIRWDNDGGRSWSQQTNLTMYVVDLRNPESPRIVGNFEVDPVVSTGSSRGYASEFFGSILLTESALLIGRTQGRYGYDWETGERQEPRYFYDIYALTNPQAPALTTRFEVPPSIAGGGWGYGPVGCGVDIGWGWWYPGYGSTQALVSGDIVASNHAEPLDDGTGRVRYFLDRLDVSDPARPTMLAKVNIPGQLAHYDHPRGHLLTLEDELRTDPATDWSDCVWRGSRAHFDDGTDVCRVWDRYLNALVLSGDHALRVSRINLDDDGVSRSVAVTNERVFVNTTERRNPASSDEVFDAWVRNFAIASNGQLQLLPRVTLVPRRSWWWPRLVGRGTRAFITESNTMTVIDTTQKTAPSRSQHEMPGWYCSSLEVSDERAYCAMGQNGVLSIDL